MLLSNRDEANYLQIFCKFIINTVDLKSISSKQVINQALFMHFIEYDSDIC